MSKARDLASGAPAPAGVTTTELGYVDGVSSAIQTQLDGKQAANANVSTTELGYLDGVTSAIQTQLNAKEPTLPSQTGNAGKYLTTDGTNKSWGTVATGSMTLLSSGTLASTGNTTISSISGSYKNLVVFIKNYANTSDDLGVRINGVSTAAGYSQFTSGGSAFFTNRLLASIFTNNTTDKSFAKLEFIDYANTTTPKFYNFMGGMTDAAATAGNVKAAWGMAVATSAITSLVFYPVNGTIASGSYELYGVN